MPEKKRTVYFHLGYPKTATTFLQRNIFPKFKGLRYLGRLNGLDDNVGFIKTWLRYIPMASNAAFSTVLPKIHHQLEVEEKRLFGEVDLSTPLLISDEALLFRVLHPLNLSWYGLMAADLETVLRRVYQIFNPEKYHLKIILCLRKQDEMLHSIYAERFFYLRNFKKCDSFDAYLGNLFRSQDYLDYGFNNLEYDYVIDMLNNLIPKDDVLILKHEDLESNQDKFYHNMSLFFGSALINYEDVKANKANVRKSSSNTRVAEFSSNNFFSRIVRAGVSSKLLNNVKKSGKKIELTISENQRLQILEKYKDSNKVLANNYIEFNDYII